MWTFTYHPGIGHDHSASMDIWREFLKTARMRHHFPGGMRVCELHKSGALHIHVLMSVRESVIWVRPLWEKMGGGRLHVCVMPSSAATYVAKYLSKEKGRFEPGTRRWACWGNWREFSIRTKDVVFDTAIHRGFAWAHPSIRRDYFKETGCQPDLQRSWRIFYKRINYYMTLYLQTGKETENAERGALAG
jgi:hypothetical protein